MGICRIN